MKAAHVRRPTAVLMVLALLCSFLVAVTVAEHAASAATIAPGSVTCETVLGSVSFKPALTVRQQHSVRVTTELKASSCWRPNGAAAPTGGTFTSKAVVQGLSCDSFSIREFGSGLKGVWQPTTIANSIARFSSVSETATSNGDVGIVLGGTASVSGSYAGNNGGADSNATLSSDLAITQLSSECEGQGLSTVPITSGTIELGPTRPVFTPPHSADFTEGTPGSVTLHVADQVKANLTWVGQLPAGLTFVNNDDGASGSLVGTPDVGTAGTYDVYLRAVDQNGQSVTQPFTITVAPIAPSVPIVTTLSVHEGLAGTGVDITGLHLLNVTSVLFGTTPAQFSISSDTSISAVAPTDPAGIANVTVVSAGGTSPATSTDYFDYEVPPQAPVLVTSTPEGMGILASWAANPGSDEVTSYSVSAEVAPGYGGPVPTAACNGSTTPVGVTTPNGGTTSMEITSGVCPGVPYLLTVAATNHWGT
jgi:hypothetical protein